VATIPFHNLVQQAGSFVAERPLDTPESKGSFARTAALAGYGVTRGALDYATRPPVRVPEIGSLRAEEAKWRNFRFPGAGVARGSGIPWFRLAADGLRRSIPRAALPAVGAASGIGAAVQGLSTPTEVYEERTGLRGVPARALGVAADLGNLMTAGLAGAVGRKISGGMTMADGLWDDVKGLFGLRGTARVPEASRPSTGEAIQQSRDALAGGMEQLSMEEQRQRYNAGMPGTYPALGGLTIPAPAAQPAAAPQPRTMTEQELRAPSTGAIPGLPTPASAAAWRSAPQVPVQQGTLRSVNPTVPQRDEENPIRIYRNGNMAVRG
jgi:hypothetical protein